MKKILMIGYCNQFFRIEYVKNIKTEDCLIDIISFEECEEKNKHYYNKIYVCDNSFRGLIRTIIIYLQFFICINLLDNYDAIHIHSVKKIEATFSHLIRKKCKRLICTIYGSDFYRISDNTRNHLSKLFRESDYITIETEGAINDFNNYYKNSFADRIIKICFGITVLDEILKLSENKHQISNIYKEFEIPNDAFVITVGYNATKEQHHIDILKEIKKVEQDLPDNYFLLIPLGYGNENYKNIVYDYFIASGMNGKCLLDFYPSDRIAKLRLCSNVMIQLQDTDLMSSSMLEYLFAGNLIITGDWLPYKEIEKFIIQISSIEELHEKIISLKFNSKINKDKNQNIDCINFLTCNYMWKNVKERWLKLYE